MYEKIKSKYDGFKQWRPFSGFKLLSYVLMFASVPMLAYGLQPYNSSILSKIILTVLTLYSGFYAALIWNDINDLKIDKIVHQNRPLPSGKISSKKFFTIALIFSVLTFIFSYFVNLWCFIFVCFAALFVAIHDKYLKNRVKFPAYSEIFTPLQWLIVPVFGFLAIPGSNMETMIILVFFTYFSDDAHDLLEGIHDIDGDSNAGVRTYATSFGKRTAAKIAFSMFFISGLLGIILFLRSILTLLFFIPFLIIWIYTLYRSYTVIKTDEKLIREQGLLVGQIGFKYLLFVYDLIFLDILIQVVFFNI